MDCICCAMPVPVEDYDYSVCLGCGDGPLCEDCRRDCMDEHDNEADENYYGDAR